MMLGRKKPAADPPAETPFSLRPEDHSEALRQLIARREQLLQDDIRLAADQKALAGAPGNQNKIHLLKQVEKLLAGASVEDLAQVVTETPSDRIDTIDRQRRALAAAVSELDQQIDFERGRASQIVIALVREEYVTKVKQVAAAIDQLMDASEGVIAFADEIERAGVRWSWSASRYGAAHALIGRKMDFQSLAAFFVRDIAEREIVARTELPGWAWEGKI